MFRLQGLIDLSRLGPVPNGLAPVESHDDLLCLSAPGVDFRWKRGFADVSAVGGVLALAAGGARDEGSGTRNESTRWIERYARHGERLAENVGGGFAVAIVDYPKRQAFLLVDRFSIETICYRASAGVVAFADTACDVPGASRLVGDQALYDYLYFHVIPAPRTVYVDVLRIEPAHAVAVTTTSVDSRRYWMPTFVEGDRRDLSGRLQGFVETLRESVKIEAEDPATACFLSGGTDSSTVAGMLTQLRDEPVHAYSIGFEALGYDEMAYARIAARHFNLVHHEYYITPEDLIEAIPAVAALVDQPFGNSSVLPAYYCAKRAKEDGFERMLAGDGGDELFAGNARYAMQVMFDLYRRLPRPLRTGVLEPSANRSPLFRRVPGLRQIGGYVRHAQVPMPDRLETFNLLLRIGDTALLDPDFLARIDVESPRAQQRATWEAINAQSLVNRMLAYDWKFTLADNDLPKVRTATALAGLTVGYPFLGRALTDLSLAIPPDWKLRRLKLRWFFKEALKGFLPDEILRKKKHGFGLPFGPWIVAHSGLRRFVEEALDGVARRGIVRPEFASDLLTKHIQEAPGYYGELVWILMMLEHWFRAHASERTRFGGFLPGSASEKRELVSGQPLR